MSLDFFHFALKSPKGLILEMKALGVSLESSQGLCQVLPGHGDWMGLLRPGLLTFRAWEGLHGAYFIRGGLFQVQGNRLQVLADALESPQELDWKRVKEAEKRALERLAERAEALDVPRALAALERARARQALRHLEL